MGLKIVPNPRISYIHVENFSSFFVRNSLYTGRIKKIKINDDFIYRENIWA